MDISPNLTPRVSDLEAQVGTLADLLGAVIAALGGINAHIALARTDDEATFRARMEEIDGDIKGLYEKLSAVRPELELP